MNNYGIRKRKPIASSITVGILLGIAIMFVALALCFTASVRIEVANAAAKSGESSTPGQAVGTAIGLGVAVAFLVTMAIIFYIGAVINSTIGFFVALNRFRAMAGSPRTYFLVMFILHAAASTAALGGFIWLLI